MSQSEIAALLKKAPLFAELSAVSLGHLAKRCTRFQAAEGRVLFSEGDPGSSLVILVSCEVDVVKQFPEGPRKIATRGPGEVVGDMALLDGQPRSATIVVSKAGELIRLDKGGFESAIRSSPAMAIALLQVLASRLRAAEMPAGRHVSLRARVASWLAAHAAEGRPVKVSKTAVAEELGARRESVSRVFSELKAARLVGLKGRDVRVLDAEGLEDVIEAG